MPYNNANKVIIGNEVVIDLTGDTVTAEKMFLGVTAHAANGQQITGTYNPVKLADVSNASVTTTQRTVSLTWSDPADVVIEGTTFAQWAGTKVVRKAGSAPADETDGTVVCDNKTRGAYASTAFVDNNVDYDTVYYYRFFPYSTDGVYTTGTALSVTPTRTAITTVPSQNGTLTYDGTEKTASWNNFDSTQLTVSGDTGTNAGDYTASFTPTENYQWSDGTRTAKTASWTIGKAAGSITLSANAVTLDADHLSATVTVSDATGTVTVSSADTTVATATLEGNTITISSPSEKSGTAAVTVSVAAAANYEATTATITVTGAFLKIVTWAGGTEDEINAMLEAAFNGQINLSDYWNLNDKRVIHHSAMAATGVGESHAAQDRVWVIMDTGENSGYVFEDGTPVHFVVGMEEGFNETGYMNSSNTNAGSWHGCARRTWCNNVLPGSFSEKSRKFFKPFKTITAETYNGSTLKTSVDNFALFAEKEIFGTRTYSNATEANALKQIKYYEVTANRIKNVNGAAAYWWERSPYSGGSSSFCSVTSHGTANRSDASSPRGLAPFGCI